TNATTFTFVDGFWQNAGQTWPHDGSEQPQRSHQTGRSKRPPVSPDLHPGKEESEVKEGPVSALWIAREKQKASPVRLPFPTNSIPAAPNSAEYSASEWFGPDGYGPDPGQGDEGHARASRELPTRQRDFPAGPMPGGTDSHARHMPGSTIPPAASVSGSTILP